MTEITPDTALQWFTASFSGNDPDKTDCIEGAFDPDGDGGHIRDSKDRASGGFRLRAAEWTALLAHLKQGAE